MLIPIRDYNPTKRTAYITITIIAINILVFLYQGFVSGLPLQHHILKYALVPWEITHLKNAVLPVTDQLGYIVGYYSRELPPFLSLIFSLFMHGSLWHLLGNMLFLWIFGNNIEDYLGRLKFILFYFLSGVSASLIHVLFHFNSNIPVIGASGAVSGIMGAYLILYPTTRIRTLVFILIFITFVDIPAFVFLIVWFAFQLLNVGVGSGIAWLAHVGGFLVGIFLLKIFRKKKKMIVEFLE